VWNSVINDADQVFLTVNGHYWPPSRTTLRNAAGHDVHLHLADYQDRYYGGSGMIRLYEFDLDRGTIEVSTRSPYMAAIPAAQRSAAQEAEVERGGPDDHFIENIDFAARFAAFAGPPAPADPPPVDAAKVVIPGTLAYWRFDGATSGPVAGTITDRSGHGNDLVLPAGVANDLAFTGAYHPAQPSRAALYFPGKSAYLRTANGAPLNQQTFAAGYTIEAFVKVPADCCGTHAWMGVLSRFGTGGEAGKTGDDPFEPPATFSFTGGQAAMQWAVFPTNFDGIKTNWTHETAVDAWHHVAIVNDGHHTVVWVDGAAELRNPRAEAIGIAQNGQPWLLGAYSYNHDEIHPFYGWVGDVRIVDHALAAKDWMTAR
jgi:hypothetical protein